MHRVLLALVTGASTELTALGPEAMLLMLPAPALAGLLYMFIKREFAAHDKRWARIEAFLDSSHKLATKEELDRLKVEFAQALTNMGNRFQEQLEKERAERVRLEKEVAVLGNELKNANAKLAAIEIVFTRK